MRTVLIPAIVGLALSGCASYYERLAAEHHERCITEFGAQLGTPAYGQCRLALEQLQTAKDVAAISAFGSIQAPAYVPQQPAYVDPYPRDPGTAYRQPQPRMEWLR